MIFSDSPRETYRHNPLKEVICQLRFPPILKITASAPAEFQEKIRSTFPLYSAESPTESLPKEINELLGAINLPGIMGQSVVHKFEDEGKIRSISLNQDFLALSEKKYTRWSDFRGDLEQAEGAFRGEYSPAFYTRIGLRYVDVIDKEALGLGSSQWTDLFNNTFLGLLAADEAKMVAASTQILVELPADVKGFMKVRHGFASTTDKKRVYMIDSDFFTQERSEPNNAFTTLDQFNRLASKFFRWAISPRLRDAMGPMPID